MKKYFVIFTALLTLLPAVTFAQTCPTGQRMSPDGVCTQVLIVNQSTPTTDNSGSGATPASTNSAGTIGTTPITPTVAQTTGTANCQYGQNAQGSCNLGYVPLEPIPGVTTGTNLTSSTGFASLVNSIFKILITAGALIAVLSLTIGGIQYMTSSSLNNKKQGIDRARAALYGLVLIAGTYLILNTINPYLLNFNFVACPGGSMVCNATANNQTTISNTPVTTTSNNGTIQTPYGTFTTQTNTNLTNATGCANSGGTWQYFTNASGGWSTGGTCYVGAAQTGVGASPY